MKMPHSPYTTDGTAARVSTAKPTILFRRAGAISTRKAAIPIARGPAIRRAMKAVTSVP